MNYGCVGEPGEGWGCSPSELLFFFSLLLLRNKSKHFLLSEIQPDFSDCKPPQKSSGVPAGADKPASLPASDMLALSLNFCLLQERVPGLKGRPAPETQFNRVQTRKVGLAGDASPLELKTNKVFFFFFFFTSRRESSDSKKSSSPPAKKLTAER